MSIYIRLLNNPIAILTLILSTTSSTKAGVGFCERILKKQKAFHELATMASQTKLETKEEIVRRFSIHNKRTGDVHLIEHITKALEDLTDDQTSRGSFSHFVSLKGNDISRFIEKFGVKKRALEKNSHTRETYLPNTMPNFDLNFLINLIRDIISPQRHMRSEEAKLLLNSLSETENYDSSYVHWEQGSTSVELLLTRNHEGEPILDIIVWDAHGSPIEIPYFGLGY